jgi:hypothetical protein
MHSGWPSRRRYNLDLVSDARQTVADRPAAASQMCPRIAAKQP